MNYIIYNLLLSKTPESGRISNGFNTTKFVCITGGISLVLFSLGYVIYGLGSVMEPISDIIDELHDSESNSDSDSDSSDSN